MSAMCDLVSANYVPMVINHTNIEMIIEKMDAPKGIWNQSGNKL
jgi:hypothetical protein